MQVARPEPRQSKSRARPTSHSRDGLHVHAAQAAQEAEPPRWDQDEPPWVHRRPGAQQTYDCAGCPRPAPKASANRQEGAVPPKAQQTQRELAGKSQQATPRPRTSEPSPHQQTAAPRKAVEQRRMTQDEVSALPAPRWAMWATSPPDECCLLVVCQTPVSGAPFQSHIPDN